MPSSPPRMTLAELVEALRDDAADTAEDLEGIRPEETTDGQAAQALEEFAEALTRIRDGEPDAPEMAGTALGLNAPLKPIGDAADTVRRLLRPRKE